MELNHRICILVHSLHAGGMERVVAELIHRFSHKKEAEIHLILYGIKRDIFYQLPQNIKIHKPNFEFNNNLRLISTIRTFYSVRKIITKINPTTILSFGEIWNSFVLISLLGKSYPIYITDRCQPNKSLGKINDFLRVILYPKATGIIAQTETAKEIYFEQFNHKNIIVIGNPIRKIEPIEFVQKENIVLSVGRLINSKHHDELIKLFVSLNKPEWKLIIVGDDAIKQQNMVRLKTLITELNADQQVFLAGKQTDVDSYYLRSKIFAFTSSSEGFPNVIGEAQSAGLPVVAFDCIAGPSDLIQNEQNGFLIPLFNYQMFATKLNLMMEDAELAESMGSRAKQSVQKFESNIISEKFYQFITSN
jgi:glycosyltransferase involved in cell wall biosynthesis